MDILYQAYQGVLCLTPSFCAPTDDVDARLDPKRQHPPVSAAGLGRRERCPSAVLRADRRLLDCHRLVGNAGRDGKAFDRHAAHEAENAALRPDLFECRPQARDLAGVLGADDEAAVRWRGHGRQK